MLAARGRDEMLAAVERMRSEVGAFFGALRGDAFFRKPERGWSPEQNLRHLIRSTRPVALSLRLPRIAFLIFGRAKASVAPEELIGRYLDVLSTGYQAGFGFRPGSGGAPGGTAPAGTADPREAARDRLLAAFDRQCDSLAQGLRGWTEEDLDRYRMPHPAAGAVTVREMLYFTLFHPYHHISKIRARLQA